MLLISAGPVFSEIKPDNIVLGICNYMIINNVLIKQDVMVRSCGIIVTSYG